MDAVKFIDWEELRVAMQHIYNDPTCPMHIAAEIEQIIDCAPAYDVVPVVHGQWEWFDEEMGTPFDGNDRDWGWYCSHCKHELPDDYDDTDHRPMLDYCPNCGAKIDGGTT